MPDPPAKQPLDASRGRTPSPPKRGDSGSWRVSPAPDGRGAPPPEGPGRRFNWRRFLILVAVLLALNSLLASVLPGGGPPPRVSYTPVFLEQVRSGNVKEISSQGDTISGEFEREVNPPGDAGNTTEFRTEVPTFANDDQLSRLLEANDVVVNAEAPNEGRGFLATFAISLLPTLLLIGVFIYIIRRAGGGAGGIGGFGRSRAKRVDADATVQRVCFDDVAGIDEAEDELVEIVDFLKNPEKYRRLGARIPRGVLLSGPPGTGKTLLARAVAGEAGAPFFSASAAEFIEMIVGVGASRVRDLFEQAKKSAPSIIFIDELDAIGRARGGGSGLGGHDEREQTLNQILTEMDGFDPSIGVIVLGATNRPEVLDSALLRPGRFDRRVAVQPPDSAGRRAILEVHTRSLPLATDVDLGSLASTTPGMVGADLANLANEAALLAARRGHEQVEMADFTDALEKLVLGTERKVIMSAEDRERTAYHEAGHAVVGMLTPGADPVRKVSIIPRGMALGVTFSAPEADRFSYDREYLLGKIKVALGGRVAEELVYGTITTGAESDIQQLTRIARNMVERWGMSEEIGPIAVGAADGISPLLPGASDTSENTQQRVDNEVERIVTWAHEEVTRLLGEERPKLDALVAALLENETLDEPEAYAAAGVARVERGAGAEAEPPAPAPA
jgi:cell division protease FtsH